MTCLYLGSFFLFQHADRVLLCEGWVSNCWEGTVSFGYMFGRMESINVVGVLEEAEYAERRACMRCYFKLNI